MCSPLPTVLALTFASYPAKQIYQPVIWPLHSSILEYRKRQSPIAVACFRLACEHLHELTGISSHNYWPTNLRQSGLIGLRMVVDEHHWGWVKALPRIRFGNMDTVNMSPATPGFNYGLENCLTLFLLSSKMSPTTPRNLLFTSVNVWPRTRM